MNGLLVISIQKDNHQRNVKKDISIFKLFKEKKGDLERPE